MKAFLFPALLFVASGAAPAQPVPTAEIDAYVQQVRASDGIPSVVVGIVRHGKPVYVKAYGEADRERHVLATPQTAYKIGSISKQVMATAILKLQDEGKLRVDDPLSRFFPDAPTAWRDVTLRRLVNHTSGFPRELPGWNGTSLYTTEDWTRMAWAIKPAAAPGAEWNYSNGAYFMLALVIERVAHKPWDRYIDETLFQPLGMRSTRTVTRPAFTAPQAVGYSRKGDAWVKDVPQRSTRPSGAFVSTVEDLIRWEQALDGKRLLSPAGYEDLFRPARMADGQAWPYGLGWHLDTFSATRVIHHGGILQGFRGEYARYVDHGLTVIVLTNLATAPAEAMAQGIARRCVPALRLTQGRPRPDRDPALSGRIREVLTQVAHERPITATSVTPPLAGALAWYPAESRATLAAGLERPENFQFLREDDLSHFGAVRQDQRVSRVRYYRLAGKPKPVYVTAFLSAEGRLAYFEISTDQP
jgi:CubicO group peptidase (beta-lactamase class C family)